jgi:hypothetical protein
MQNSERHENPRPDDAGDQLLDKYEHARKSKLSVDEIARLRVVLEKQARWDWVGASIKTWAVWIVAVIGAYTVGFDALVKSVKSLAGH